MAHRVTAPYITVQTRTRDGNRIIGLYEGATLPDDVPADQVKHHLDRGMIEEVKEPKDSLTPAAPPAEPPAPEGWQEPEPPAKNASKADWVDYAVSQGMPRADAEKATRDDLAATFGD